MKYLLISLLMSKQNGRIFLQDTCTDGIKAIKSLSSWMQKNQPGKSCNAPNQSQGKTCQYDITDCLPEQVVKLQGVNPKVSGPNCWNLALVMGKILPNLRYSPPKR